MERDEYGNLIDENGDIIEEAPEVTPKSEQVMTAAPSLIKRYREDMAKKDEGIESAAKTKNMLGYANVAGDLINSFNNSQKSDIVLKNRMSDLGRKPNIIEAERSRYDRSVLDNMGKEGLATARDERQRVDSTFKNQMGLESLQRQNDAAMQKSDPDSAESISAREFIKNTIPGASNIRGIDKMSAAQLEKLSPNLYKQSLADKSNATKIQIAQIGAGSSKEKAAQAAADKASAVADKADAKAESRYVPGVGTAITDMDAKTVKDAAVMKDKFDRALQEMIDLRTKHNGGAILNREDVERGRQLSKDLLLTYKDMAKLGVLSVADEKILNAIIPPDPLAYSAAGVIGQDPIMSNLKKLKGDTSAQYEKSLSVRLKDREMPREKAPDKNLVGKIIINKKTGKRFIISEDGISMTPADDQIGGN